MNNCYKNYQKKEYLETNEINWKRKSEFLESRESERFTPLIANSFVICTRKATLPETVLIGYPSSIGPDRIRIRR